MLIGDIESARLERFREEKMIRNNSQRTLFWFINLLLTAFLISGCVENEKTNATAECVGSECDISNDGGNEECTGEDCDDG